MIERIIGMAFFGALLAISIYIIISVATDETPSTTINYSAVPAEDRTRAEAATKILLRHCHFLMRYNSEIEEFNVLTDNHLGMLLYPKKYGWQQWVSFHIKLKKQANTQPGWNVFGEHLYYAVGPSGIDVTKPKAGNFCGRGHWAGLIPIN